jgi:hypothetical protein
MPKEWKPADGVVPIDTAPAYVKTDPKTGAKCTLLGTLLSDYTSVWILYWKGGHRCARTAAATNWAIEERFFGRCLRRYKAIVAEGWSTVMESMVAAAKETRKALADPKCSSCGTGLDIGSDGRGDGSEWVIDFDWFCVDCGERRHRDESLIRIPVPGNVYKTEGWSAT